MKQTYDILKPKRTFTPYVSNHQSGIDGWDAEIIVHGPQSTRYGWEWYEMGFIACWNPSGLITLVCFDVPERTQSNIQSLFGANTVDTSSPYAAFALISDALLRLYDDSVWSIRNHISQWEAVSRLQCLFLKGQEKILHAAEKIPRGRLLSFARNCKTRGTCQRDVERSHTVTRCCTATPREILRQHPSCLQHQ